PLAGNDLEPFEQSLRFLAPVGFDDAGDDIVAVALARARLLQHFVGLADSRRGADEDFEPAGLPLFAPRGLEQGLRRRSLVRVAPLVRHQDSRVCPWVSRAQRSAKRCAADLGPFETVAVPDQRCTAVALHRIRDTRGELVKYTIATTRGG